MRLHYSFDDGFGFNTDPEDAELAGHVRGFVEAGRDLATYVAGESRRQCSQCGETRACRPLALQNEAGQPTLAPVCAPCQERLAQQRMDMARQRVDADDDDGDSDE